MLPLSLLKAVQNHPMLVELKNGETYNGHLVSCDSCMNIFLREVICTSRDGDRFWKMTECYVKGNNIKYMRIPDEVIDLVKEDSFANSMTNRQSRSGPKNFARGGAKGRGRGTGPPGKGFKPGGNKRKE